MSVSPNFRDYVLEQLHALGELRARRMFGGEGLYCGDLFFGLIADDVLYLKVDDSNRGDYVARGCEAFRPYADDPNSVSMSYFRVPEDILEDDELACGWGRKAVKVAASAAATKAFRKSHGSPARRAKTAAKAKPSRPRGGSRT